MAKKATPLNTLNVSKEDSKGWDSSGWKWKEVDSRTQKSRVKQPLVKHAARVPSSLNTISISFFWELHEMERYELPGPEVHEVFITGIELMWKDQPLVRLGYMFSESQVTYQIESFKGFEVATNHRGIHAVRMILGDDGPKAMWVGKFYKGASITDRLTLANNDEALEASFDDEFRMVNLAVGSEPAPEKEE